MMTISSAMSNTSLGLCSTSTMESPLSFSRRMVLITSATICGARPSDGSSIRGPRGFAISARASEILAHSQALEDAPPLRDQGDPLGGDQLRRQARDRAAEDLHRAGARWQEADGEVSAAR